MRIPEGFAMSFYRFPKLHNFYIKQPIIVIRNISVQFFGVTVH
jgi:hypothetical protein